MDDGSRLRELVRAERVGGRKGYGAEVRAAVLERVEERRRQGIAIGEIAREVGVSVGTLQSWSKQRAGFVRVEVSRCDSNFVLRSEAGFWIEGLSLSEVAELLRRVR